MPRRNQLTPSQSFWARFTLSLLLLVTSGCSSTKSPPAQVPESILVETLDRALRQAIELYATKDFAAAEADLRSLRLSYPDNSQAALYLGRLYFATERFAEAVDELQHAVDLEGDLALHHLWLGRALGEYVQRVPAVRKLPLARRIHATFLRALELDPLSTEAHLALARFYSEAPPFAGGNPAAAQQHTQRLTELDPPAGLRLQGKLFEGAKRLEEAEAAYLAAIDADPEDVESYRQAGEFFQRQERSELALEMFERARLLEPEGANPDR